MQRFGNRVGAYLALMDDRYPSTDDHQSVHLDCPYPDASRDLSRWLPIVKWLLAIPHYLVLAFLDIAAVAVVIVAWFAILLTGRYPRGMFDFVQGFIRWYNRVIAYALTLVTDRYPLFRIAATSEHSAVAGSTGRYLIRTAARTLPMARSVSPSPGRRARTSRSGATQTAAFIPPPGSTRRVSSRSSVPTMTSGGRSSRRLEIGDLALRAAPMGDTGLHNQANDHLELLSGRADVAKSVWQPQRCTRFAQARSWP